MKLALCALLACGLAGGAGRAAPEPILLGATGPTSAEAGAHRARGMRSGRRRTPCRDGEQQRELMPRTSHAGVPAAKVVASYVTVGSARNANGIDTTKSPPRDAIYSYASNGTGPKVFATGVRNGEGLAFAPDGALWAAVNERDNVPYPFHQAYGGLVDACGKIVQSYVNENPPDEVAKLTPARNLGWPFCNPSAERRRVTLRPGWTSTACASSRTSRPRARGGRRSSRAGG